MDFDDMTSITEIFFFFLPPTVNDTIVRLVSTRTDGILYFIDFDGLILEKRKTDIP